MHSKLAGPAVDTTSTFRLLSLSAALIAGIVPFTIIFMVPTNNALFKKAETLVAKADDNDAETAQLMQKWRFLNLVRAVLTASGAVTAAWTIVSTL
jgi:hypothetical protein